MVLCQTLNILKDYQEPLKVFLCMNRKEVLSHSKSCYLSCVNIGRTLKQQKHEYIDCLKHTDVEMSISTCLIQNVELGLFVCFKLISLKIFCLFSVMVEYRVSLMREILIS